MSLESVQFSDEVIKINRKEKHQQRCASAACMLLNRFVTCSALVITNHAIYNFAPKKFSSCKRSIPIRELKAVILSRASDEMVFQVDKSYDYR